MCAIIAASVMDGRVAGDQTTQGLTRMTRRRIRDHDEGDANRELPDGSPDETPDGVLHVTVGRRKGDRPVEGAREAHVARIHDLPSLIRAVVDGD